MGARVRSTAERCCGDHGYWARGGACSGCAGRFGTLGGLFCGDFGERFKGWGTVRTTGVAMFSASGAMTWNDGRREARDRDRTGTDGAARYPMSGGTDCEASRETGPRGMAVTGTSMSEKGVPNRYGATGVCRSGDRASALSIA
jgi:hypothetical protein